MTIVPDHHNLSDDQEQQQLILIAKGGGGGYAPVECCYHGIDSGLTMAEEESRATGFNQINEEAATSASGSKGFRGLDVDEDEDGWLQLSIGGRRDCTGGIKSGDGRDRSVPGTRGLVELDLLPPSCGSNSGINKPEATSSTPTPPTIGLTIATPLPPLLFQHHHGSGGSGGGTGSGFPHPHPEIINWGFQPVFRGQGVVGSGAVAGTSSISSYPSSSSSSVPYASSYFGRPFQLQIGKGEHHGAVPTTDIIKIIDPPRRRHSGIWLMLLASKNKDKESYFPQIPKSYLRIKDGRMTVRLLTKYLVDKLKLDSESEVEITCRGQELRDDFTLQHIRDNIWRNKDHSSSSSVPAAATATSLRDSSTVPHLMVLHYSRRRSISTLTPTT